MAERSCDLGLKSYINERERLIAIAVCIVESHAVAEEIVQESWLRWSKQSYLADAAAPLFKSIVRNLAHDWRRRRHRELRALPYLASLVGETPCSERTAIAKDELRCVVEALRKLPPRTFRAFSLRFVHGLTYDQIGKKIGLSLSRSRTLVETAMVDISIAIA